VIAGPRIWPVFALRRRRKLVKKPASPHFSQRSPETIPLNGGNACSAL
jgi:hypothetical protein